MNDLNETEDYASFQAAFSETDFDPHLLPDREPLCATNYVPIRSLGQGAFGEAILYRKTADNSLVVWKEVDLSRMDSAQKSSALGEVEILSSLPRHPNIIQYFTHYQSYPPEDPVLLIEMEYANGGNLLHYISSADSLLDQPVVEWLFFQLMSAVAHIHAIPILHRDIKTLNIFLTRSAALVKLGDFGISKKLDSSAAFSETVVGTPYYMSPELMQGLPYNQKSDIWACGCVLVELLTLRKSFDATNALRLANDVVHGKFQFEVNEERYTSCIKELVHWMLQPKPEDRPEAVDVLHGDVFGSKYE